MLKCENCNEVFDRENVNICREDMGEHFGTPVYEEVACCPHCGASDLVEVEQCEHCGGYFERHEMDDSVCEECQGETLLRLRKMIETNFTGVEMKIIRNAQEDQGFDEWMEERAN